MAYGAQPGRHAVLVDAGYLYASAGQLVLGRSSRRDFRVAAEPLIAALLARAADRAPGELLRMYWYDAARDRVPTVEQRQIAALPHVKVRLGNLNSVGQQKGVDAQLRADLELLARHRAVCDVILVTGDEDMLPAVEAAQAYGVRVHVWGVEPAYGGNQAERLIWEADTVDQLDAAFCRPFLSGDEEVPAGETRPATAGAASLPPSGAGAPAGPVEGSAPAGPVEGSAAEAARVVVPTPADVFAGRRPAPPPAPVGPVPVASFGPGHPGSAHSGAGHPGHGLSGHGPAADRPDRPGPERPEMEQVGARIAARWLVTRGRDNVADLLPGPVLPTVIDKELLVEAEEEISRSLRPYEEARRALRDGFWAKLHAEFGITDGPLPAWPTPAAAPDAAPPTAPAPRPGAPATPPGSSAPGAVPTPPTAATPPPTGHVAAR